MNSVNERIRKMLAKEFPELPGWSFNVDEVSAGVYRASGRDQQGRKVEMTGFDPDALLERCKQAANEIGVS